MSEKKEKPNYGGAGWHIVTNLATGLLLFFLGIYEGMYYHLGGYLLSVFSPYFIYNAGRWARGNILEERLRIRNELINLVQPRENDKILDVGTGGGLLAIGFAKRAKCKAVGIDIWLPFGGGTSMDTAEKNARIEGVNKFVTFKKADARNIPFPDEYFDVVVASFVIHMIKKDRIKALQEMIRVLKPKGKFAIIEPPRGIGGWVVDEKLKEVLKTMGLTDIKFQPLPVSYPKKRNVYIIYGKKT
ncbi:hypothetical protein DRP07_01270 [Archaeoglobales archaeon]|nr:MAG: hypothetical protein DRP07_01270 [Archaeoglobales archaeon]